MDKDELSEVLKYFAIEGDIVEFKPLGHGLINTTIFVKTDKKEYVLQLINHKVFPNVDALMDNIVLVTNALESAHMATMRVIYTNDDKPYLFHNGKYYRLYAYVPNTTSFEVTDDLHVVESAGRYLGKFHLAMKDVDMKKIIDPIPDFHNTPKRFQAFMNVLQSGNPKRIQECQKEIEFLLSFKDKVSEIEDGLKSGYIIKRVTHNDTKLNNYLFDVVSNEAICLVDFDTIMGSSALYDFGDATRYLCNKAGEDEKDLNKVKFDINLFRAFTKGYLFKGKFFLTKKEIELLPYSSLLMALELSLRFLADYLNDDVYFKIKYEKHNLFRARNQITVAKSILSQYDTMQKIVKKYC